MSVLKLSPEQRTELMEIASRPRRSLDLGRTDLGKWLGMIMRLQCPVAGEDWSKLLSVRLDPGDNIGVHAHKRHLVLFYPQPCVVIIGGAIIQPCAGEIIYVEPHTLHSVPAVLETRVSVAMLVSDEN